MSRLVTLAILLVCASFPAPMSAQFTRILSDKRTIEIRASDKVSVPAEIATIKVGYQNEADTKDMAYEENKKVSARILQALLSAKVSKEAIETQTISLERKEEVNDGHATKPARFTADQEWRIHVKAGDAQQIVDITVAAGANQVSDVDWSVVDPPALEAKAYAAALTRAKLIAENTASQAGIKLGEILSITNVSNNSFVVVNAETASISSSETYVRSTPLALFAPMIEREAAVDVVYAIDK
jgi:uncharacterized protein